MSDATRLRFADVAERLTGGRTFSSPPPGWTHWQEPAQALPIDQAISGLRRSNRVHRLRPREELSERGITCPYYAMRWATGMAADAATVMAADDPKDMVRRWSLLEDGVAQARDGIAAITQSLTTAQAPVTRWPLREDKDIVQAYELMVFVLHQTGVMDRMITHARQAREVFQGNQGDPGDVWKLVFAADLGLTWCMLTGTPPARTEPFMAFVAAAHDSLLDTPPVTTWERAVRRALELGLDFERYEKEFLQKQAQKPAIG